jgi:hypothetical protein
MNDDLQQKLGEVMSEARTLSDYYTADVLRFLLVAREHGRQGELARCVAQLAWPAEDRIERLGASIRLTARQVAAREEEGAGDDG